MSPQEAAQALTEAFARGDEQGARELMDAMDADQAAEEARLTAPGALVSAALWYASTGIDVFPILPRQKRPATIHGFKDATTDPGIIHRWWDGQPDRNVGLPTGKLFDVIDIDGPEGYRSLLTMQADGVIPPVIGRALTPHGLHLYIRPTGDGNSAALMPGVDYRGRGGYVLAAPSATTDGTYRWTTPLTLEGQAS